jgi:hypothetical protein
MLVHPPSCNLCRMYQVSTAFLPDSSPAAPKIGIMVDYPEKADFVNEEPWTAKGRFDRLIEPSGLKREDILFTSAIRCHPERVKYGELPTFPAANGLQVCRQYDGRLIQFNPNLALVCESPRKLIENPALHRLIQSCIIKAYSFYQRGYRPLVLMGITPVKLVFPWCSNIKNWLGHWDEITGWPYSGASQMDPKLKKVA